MGWIYSGLEHQELGRDYSDRELFARVFRGVKPYKKPFTLIALMVLLSTIINLTTPLILANVLVNLGKGAEVTETILLGGVLYLGLYILMFVGYYIMNWAMALLVPDYMVDLRSGVFDKIQEQDLKFFDKRRSGKLTSRVGADAAEVGGMVMLLATFSGNLLLVGITFIILYILSPALALVTLIIVPFIIAFTWFFRRIARRLSRNYRQTIASVNAAMAESIEGIQVAKSYGRERETVERFERVNNENYRAGLRQGTAMEFIFPTLDLFFIIGLFIIIRIGGVWAINGENNLSVASLYLFILYLGRFFFPLMQLSTFYSQIQAGFAAYERILEVEDSLPEVYANPAGKQLDSVKGDIKFQGVFFAYKANEYILENFTLHIKAGEKIAIVGHTGAGKTTLANLIARFYEFQDGKILIDDTNIRDLNLKSYRKNLGIVQQEPFLFSGTVEENIRYGNHAATIQEINDALNAVHATEFISYLPDGLKTDVGERGNRLSTGQRQLICFARAILANPKILILDEATSAIDAYTEAVIQDALEVLFNQRTSVVIAHRLSTIVNSDRIIVMS